jgi:hypothetical protein
MPSQRAGRSAWVWVALVAILLSGAGLSADTGTLQPGDWQYRELDALSRAGLLSGRPRGSIGDWTDRLTRFEAASLVMRAVEGLGQAYQEQGRELLRIAQAEKAEEPAASVGPGWEDVARVEKLIEEFRAELVAMGVRVDDLSSTIKDVQQRLSKVEAEQKKHKLDGYVQFRYEDDDATAGKEQFVVRRARFNVRGPANDRVSYRVEFQLDAKESGKGRGSKVQLRTAYADYTVPKGRIRVGQAKIPWGYELLESVPKLWTSERAVFMDRLFPNQRDIGVQWSYRRSSNAPQLDLGIFNGTGINANDNNDRKNVMARVDFPVANGTVALSSYVGKDGDGLAATDQDRHGVSAQLAWRKAEFMGEFVTGKDRGHDVRGWYAQIGHPLAGDRPNLLFAKFDTYDENRDASNDLFKRWSLGYWYQLDSATRLTLVHERREPEPGFSEITKWDGDATYLQLQVQY